MTPHEARDTVLQALRRIAPDADLDAVAPGDDLRAELELDSLDFLSFIEMLSERSGQRIDEDEYPRVTTIASCVDFLSRQPA
jgi:acyl carrier protein